MNPISRAQKHIKEVGIGPNAVFIVANLSADRQNSRSGMGIFSKARESRGRPIHRWNRAELYLQLAQDIPQKYFTAISYEG